MTAITDPRGVRVARNEYDDDGRLIATLDADGHRIEYDHDIQGRQEQVRDRRGNLNTYIYDDNGWVLSETNALGETTLHTYDANGNELTRTDPLGHVTTWTYDARGNALTETNHLGQTTTSTYSGRNALLTQVDALGHAVITNAYDDRTGALLSTRDALGHVTAFGYDSGIGSGGTGELESMTDALNQVTTYELDHQNKGWRVAEVDAAGNRTTYTHDAMGRVLTATTTRTTAGTNGAGASAKALETLTTTYTYDAKGRLTRTDLPDGRFTTTEYNGIDKPTRECDADGACTEHVYDARGQEIETRYADGGTESRAYDANGNVVAQTDRGGRTTRFVYDAAGRLTETVLPDPSADDGNDANNPRTRSAYDAAGRLTASVDENGHRIEYRYDAAGRRTHVIDARAGTTVSAYDAAGRRTGMTDAEGQTTTFVYDAAGRLTETHFPDGSATRVEYDALSRKTAEVDPDGRRSEYGYDALGRLIAVRSAVGTAAETLTRYRYDEQGNRIEQTDAENRTTRFEFDAGGRETARVLPSAQRETKTYDVAGRLASQTDFSGKTTRWSYDALGRTSGIDYPNDADVSVTYTPTGQRASATDGHGTATWAYDRRDRVVRKTDASGRAIEYTYDAAGNLLSRVTANQSLVYTYDELNRMTSVTATVGNEPPRTTTYEYDRVGNRTAMVGADGVRTEYGYDSRNRLRNLAKRTAAGALLFAAAYTVDATGLRTAVEESDAAGLSRTVAYQYDPLKRLTREAIVDRDASRSRTATWSYDRVGNRLTQVVEPAAGDAIATTYAYDVNDRLLTESVTEGVGGTPATTSYAYDANGNTILKTTPTGVIEYAYDDANRLKELRRNGERTTYAYDVDGLRIAQTSFPATGEPTTTRYLQDANRAYAQVIEEFSQQGAGVPQLEAVFTFGDELLSQTRAGTTRFVHADGFGSTRFLTDAAATITDTWSYDAFGNEIARTGTTPTEHLYRGEQFDPNLGFYYLRARYYDPSIGRFATMDSFAGYSMDPPSLHKYLYTHADPINGIDPSGNFTISEAMTTLNTTVTLANLAITSYNSIFGDPDRPTIDGIPTIWDVVMAVLVRGVAGAITPDFTGAGSGDFGGSGPRDRHHVIPVFCCGHINGARSQIARSLHTRIHNQLERYAFGINVIGITVDLIVYKRPTSRIAKTPLQRMGTKRIGRVAIAAGLAAFYFQNGYLEKGVPSIGAALLRETPRFIGSHHSAPYCQRIRRD